MPTVRVASTALPDLALVLRRDGEFVSWTGGDAVPVLRQMLSGDAPWSEATKAQLAQLAKKCIAGRTAVEANVREAGADYDVRCTPQGPDRVICTLRASLAKSTDDTADETGVQRRPGFERRGFTRLLRDRVARATLQEKPLSVAVIQIDGLAQIAQTIGSRTADRIFDVVLRRIGEQNRDSDELFGQIGESVLALIVEDGDRGRVEERLVAVTETIRQPHVIEAVEFQLSCHVGIAVLGLGGATPTQLLDAASAAAAEARRGASRSPRFHTDTVRVRALARFDLARELRSAVERRQLGFRFARRHALATGELDTLVAYLHWPHELRGNIPPTEFLAIAESVGFAASLSRTALEQLCAEFGRHMQAASLAARLSFGPLRDHVLNETFVDDVLRSCEMHGVPLERLELRLAERAFVNVDLGDLQPLQSRGVRLVVDEVGRGASSLAGLARARIWGLQIDRAWVTRPDEDATSSAICAAIPALARAFGMEAIATGIDTVQQRDRMVRLGYTFGSGDLYL